MSRYEFKVGGRVRIRSWDGMLKEFGGGDAHIDVPQSFTEEMRPLCGVAATIKEIYTKGVVELGDWDTNNDAACWTFTTGMLEPAFIAGRCYQLHDASDTRDGNIIKVAASSETRFSYETVRGEDNLDSAGNNSVFADCLVPLYGKQVGEAIRAWDAKHSKAKVREVKRKAKVGETIKVVKAQCNPTYENGDILTVRRISPGGGVWVKDFSGGEAYLCDSEYVVLENCKVTDSKSKEVKRKAKVGEYVKMLDTDAGYCKDDICEVIALYKGGDGDVFIRTKEMQSSYDAVDASRPIEQPFSYAMQSEYVVLEGYKPEQEEPTKAKVGDTIKILKDNCGKVKPGTIWKVKSIDFGGDLRITHKDDDLVWACRHDNYVVISSGKHSYTAEQIAEARQIVLDTICELAKDSIYVFFTGTDENIETIAYIAGKGISVFGENGSTQQTLNGLKAGNSKCSDHDEPNEWIGKCVALCKALKKPVPNFILEGGK